MTTIKQTYHYDAFISYNHNPQDIKIASMLQQKLEHFRVPKNIQSRAKKDKIERVFLDKGELGVADDLNEEIMHALENSEHLIVICSKQAKASPWVKKEIMYFLQTHTKEDILTVVTDGEPSRVLPEILTYRETTAEDGTITKEPVEPLSCDYRGSIRQANRTELPRLVSALIGCRYDDLVQRQRHYRMQRLMVLLAVIAAILFSALGYFIWSNHQIKTNLEKAQIEESKTLAIQSETALNDGDRIGAIESALKGLPIKNNKRPVVSESVLALSNAMDVYKAPSMERITAVREYKGSDVMGYATSGQVKHLDAVKDKKSGQGYLMAIYAQGDVWIWDTKTGKPVMSYYLDKLYKDGTSFYNGRFCDDTHVILLSSNQLYYLDVEQGKCLWNKKYDGEYRSGIAQGRWSVIIDKLQIAKGYIYVPALVGEVDNRYNEIRKIDLKDGSIEKTMKVADTIMYLAVSPDGKQLAYSCAFAEEGKRDQVYCTSSDLDTPQKLQQLGYVSDLAFKKNGYLVACGLDQKPDVDDLSQFSYADVSSNTGRTITEEESEKTVEIACWDTGSTQPIWEKSFKESFSGIPYGHWNYENEALKDYIPCITGDKLRMFDKSGKELFSVSFGSTIDDFWEPASKANGIGVVLQNGETANYSIKTNRMVKTNSQLQAPVEGTIVAGDSVFAVCSNNKNADLSQRILEYQVAGTDARWSDYEAPDYDSSKGTGAETAAETQETDRTIIPYKGSFIEISHRNDPSQELAYSYAGKHVLRRNSESGRIMWQETLFRSDDDYLFRYAGIDEDKGEMYFQYLDTKSLNLVAVNLKDGSSRKLEMQSEDIGISSVICDTADICDGKMYLLIARQTFEGSRWYYDLALMTADLSTEKITDIKTIRKIKEEEYTTVSGNVRPAMDAANKRLALYINEAIEAYDFDGNQICCIKDLGYQPDSIAFAKIDGKDDELVIAEMMQSKTNLHRYDAAKGTELDQAVISMSTDSYGKGISVFSLTEDETLVVIGVKAFVLGAGDWKLRTSITGYKSYNPQTRMFYLGTDENENGCIPYCSLEDMIKIGQDAVGSGK